MSDCNFNPVPKPSRHKSKKLTSSFREFSCVARTEKCLAGSDVVFEHYKTVGSGGDDSLENGNPFCVACHDLKNRIGAESFWYLYGIQINLARLEQGFPVVPDWYLENIGLPSSKIEEARLVRVATVQAIAELLPRIMHKVKIYIEKQQEL